MSNNKNMQRPFLKWAGNKFRIMDHIHEMLPTGKRLIEPFAGSGAVFLNTRYKQYLLGDSNADLIMLYNTLKAEGETFIDTCARLFNKRTNKEEYFYNRRNEFNRISDPARKSALFVYFNRHGYNGLCRYNSKGGFNVPFGRYNKPYFPADEMYSFYEKAQQAEFVHLDFSRIMHAAKPGDVIYCDPPYVPLSASASFTTYSAGGFDMSQQEELAQLAEKNRKRGIPVLISNHNTRFTQQAYQSADNIRRFQVRRLISCNGKKRQHAGELLALFT